MTRLALLATGGTIATRSAATGRTVALDATALLATATVPPGADVVAVDVAGRPSFATSLDDLAALARTVHAAAVEHDGVVVTHGTDTLEETAFLLALTAATGSTVTLTGAQRPADDPAPDGPANLTAALAHAARAVPGVTVTFAGRVLPAVGVRKVHTEALAAFAVPGAPEDGALLALGASEVPSLANGCGRGSVPEVLPRVDVVAHYVGVDAHALHAAVDAGARGVVLAAFGAGNTTPAIREGALALLARGVPVAVASRTGAGPVAGLYAGGGADLAAAGALFAGDLSPWQTRLLLSMAIAASPDDPLAAAHRWCVEAGVLR